MQTALPEFVNINLIESVSIVVDGVRTARTYITHSVADMFLKKKDLSGAVTEKLLKVLFTAQR